MPTAGVPAATVSVIAALAPTGSSVPTAIVAPVPTGTEGLVPRVGTVAPVPSVIAVHGATAPTVVLARTVVRDGSGRLPPDTLLVDVPLGGRARSVYASWGGPLSWMIALGALAWWLVPAVIGRVRRR